jgi:hypothetical protein
MAFIAGAGAGVFSNVDPYMATVIPCKMFEAIMTHYPINDHFSRQMRASGVQDLDVYGRNLETQFQRGWCNVWSPTLSDVCLPPVDKHIDSQGKTRFMHYRYLATIDDIKTPQMGLENDDHPTWLHASYALSENSRLRLARKEETEV